MEYYEVEAGGFSGSGAIVAPLYPQEFLRFVKDGKIDRIFILSGNDPFLKGRQIGETSKGSRYFVATDGKATCFLDSRGFESLAIWEESIENGAYYSINRLKEVATESFWREQTGTIYQILAAKGYKSGDEIEEAFSFFEGRTVFNRDEFLALKKSAENGKFRTFKSLCIAKSARFKELADLEDAEQHKTPNMVSLQALRIMEEIQWKFKLRDLSEGLVSAIIFCIAAEKQATADVPVYVDLKDIAQFYYACEPKQPYEGFGGFRSEKDIVEFLLSERTHSFGHFDYSNSQFQVSWARIYVDGANIAHKGTYSGEKRDSLEKPDMELLRKCYFRLKDENLGAVKIYVDGLTGKYLMKNGTARDKEIIHELMKLQAIEFSVTGEQADNTLLQKLRDDPFAYVVANDGFATPHHLTERDRQHLVVVEFDEADLGFGGIGYDSLVNKKEMGFEPRITKEILKHAREFGTWPYTDSWFEHYCHSFSLD